MAIPARIGSTRLPRKVLLEIKGKPMLHHVIERCLGTELVEEVFVVTDAILAVPDEQSGSLIRAFADVEETES